MTANLQLSLRSELNTVSTNIPTTRIDNNREFRDYQNRENIRCMILERLQRRYRNVNQDKLQKCAHQIEHRLHEQQITLSSDNIEQALDEALYRLMETIESQRRLSFMPKCNEVRMNKLRTTVGTSVFHRICSSVKSIYRIRQSYTCNGGATCCMGPLLPGNQKVPLAVMKVFQQIDLITVIENVPAEDFSKIEWEPMLLDAAQKLQEYSDWMLSSKNEESRDEMQTM